ncbi:hypothetical protein NC652_022079 [Populus alba x Populus x berolinensis]|nr:hypothetical protein NC652_022079 [Populus alba x Populus x berolinensis]
MLSMLIQGCWGTRQLGGRPEQCL